MTIGPEPRIRILRCQCVWAFSSVLSSRFSVRFCLLPCVLDIAALARWFHNDTYWVGTDGVCLGSCYNQTVGTHPRSPQTSLSSRTRRQKYRRIETSLRRPFPPRSPFRAGPVSTPERMRSEWPRQRSLSPAHTPAAL